MDGVTDQEEYGEEECVRDGGVDVGTCGAGLSSARRVSREGSSNASRVGKRDDGSEATAVVGSAREQIPASSVSQYN